MTSNDSVESKNHTVGTIALINGFANPAEKKNITITIYVKTAILIFLIQLVSHFLSSSTRLFLALMSAISCSRWWISNWDIVHEIIIKIPQRGIWQQNDIISNKKINLIFILLPYPFIPRKHHHCRCLFWFFQSKKLCWKKCLWRLHLFPKRGKWFFVYHA